MALKDLVAQKSAITEEAIENIIGKYVRYDVDERDVAFTPEFSVLSNKAKILIYLTAIIGWPFVVDDPVSSGTKPADLSEKLGIPGGSLRPILKELKDRHFVTSKGEGYSVRASNLTAVHREIDSTGGSVAPPRKRKVAKRPKASNPAASTGETSNGGVSDHDDAPGKPKKRKGASGGDIAQTFKGWVHEGFFDNPKTLANVQARFHDEAILIPRTSIPKYLLGGVRDKSLSRAKQDVNGKLLWTYQTKSKV